MYGSVASYVGLFVIAVSGLSACSTFAPKAEGPQPQTVTRNIPGVDTGYGPRRPTLSGYNSEGQIALPENSGVFGTTDPISVDGGGPFPDNSLSLDTSLSDLGPDPFDGDISGDAALLAGLDPSQLGGSSAEFGPEIEEMVYFDTNSDELSEEARETLRQQTAWLQLHPNMTATIEGHADERGTREYNLALGERRASAVRGYMTALGIEEDRLRKISYGKERPLVPGSDEFAWAQNRRATTVLDGAAAASYRAPDLGGSGSGDSIYDDPLLDPSLDALLGTEGADPLLDDIPENPVLRRIQSGS